MKARKAPRFYALRIYLFSILIYYLLVLPFFLMLYVKNAADFDIFKAALQKAESNQPRERGDSLMAARQAKEIADTLKTFAADTTDGNINISLGSASGSATGNSPEPVYFQFKILLVTILIGFLVNIPFKIYFKRRRRKKPIPPALFRFCKQYILKTPLINSAILLAGYGIGHAVILYELSQPAAFSSEGVRSFFQQYCYISLVASLLTVTFVFYWQKHRVHIQYLEYIYGEDELRSRIFRGSIGKIKNKLWVASGMTTLLPLIVVILYLFQSITHITELKIEMLNMSPEMKRVLFGDLVMLNGVVNLGDSFYTESFYVNAINAWFMFLGIYVGIFVALMYIFFFVKWTTEDIVYPVKELLASMKLTGKGEICHYTVVRTNDEIGELAEGYNEMSGRIHNYIGNISRLSEAYFRFVPRQFLELLGKKNITDISLGDQVQKEMSVLFTDIRDFTSLSEAMTLKENFDFVNSYLGLMEPIISNNNGFIDKYMGDSIMALFDGNVENALNAAIEMKRTLNDYNQIRVSEGREAIEMGIGIHTGNLMLGVVGGYGKMEGTVISDAVNLASRLEGLTKLYGSSIIISQDTLIKVEDPSAYLFRYLDIVKVKGKQESVYIFEILDGDKENIKVAKNETKRLFAKGVEMYRGKVFSEALVIFGDILQRNPHDKAASLYIRRCNEILQKGLPADWDGVEIMNTK
jgi:class 3 adenylate cyclase